MEPDLTAYDEFIKGVESAADSPAKNVLLALNEREDGGAEAVLNFARRAIDAKAEGKPLIYDDLTGPERVAIKDCGFVAHYDRLYRRGMMVMGSIGIAAVAAVGIPKIVADVNPVEWIVDKFGLKNVVKASLGTTVVEVIAGTAFLKALANEKQRIVTTVVDSINEQITALYEAQKKRGPTR